MVNRAARRGLSGSALLVALGITFVLGMSLTSYLILVQRQNLSVARSHAWNAALAVAEAGVEEAMAHINPSALIYLTNVNYTANGWVAADGGYRAPRRVIGNGYYDVWISAGTLPAIFSTGVVTSPLFSQPLRRVVRVTTKPDNMFDVGMAVRWDVDFKGFRVETDSFDSADPNYSTNGLYDPLKRKDSGDVATTLGLLNVGNAKVMGRLRTGPEADMSLGANGSVGDLAWVASGTRGLKPGHYRNDFNVDFPDVALPFSTGLSPQAQQINGTNFHWVLGSGNYVDLSTGGTRIPNNAIVYVTGAAKVYIPGDFTMVGSSQILIAPGASLEMYVAGRSALFTRVNNAGNCNNFKYFGLPSNTSVTMGGNDAFLGSVYAPNADYTLGGGGSDPIDFQGACVVNSVKLNGHYKFHFDENLRRRGPYRAFVVASWQEI